MRGYKRLRDRRKPENQKGSIRSWQLVVEGERNAAGKRQQLFRAFRGTSSQADSALRKLVDEVERGLFASDGGKTYGAWLDDWLSHKTAGHKSLKRNSLTSYRSLIEKHIKPCLGHLRLSRCTPYALQRFIDDQTKNGRLTHEHIGEPLSPSTIRRIYSIMSAAFAYAVRMRYLSSNPASEIGLPRPRKTKPRPLSVAEGRALITSAAGTRLYVPVMLAICTGLRRGEILGLRWHDIDFATGRTDVRRQIIRGGLVDEPKRDASVRSVVVPEFALAELLAHRSHQESIRDLYGERYAADRYVFADEFGAPWNPDGINTLFRSIVKRAGLTKMRFHDLRHSAGSLLIAAGVPLPVVSELLGHSDKAFTMRQYIHAQFDGQTAAAEYMEVAFGTNA